MVSSEPFLDKNLTLVEIYMQGMKDLDAYYRQRQEEEAYRQRRGGLQPKEDRLQEERL